MSLILVIGASLLIIGIVFVTEFLTRSDDQGDVRDELWSIHGSLSAVKHTLNMHKDGSIELAEVEKELARASDEVDRHYRMYRAESNRNRVIGYWTLVAAVGAMVVAVLFHFYLVSEVENAYQRGMQDEVLKLQQKVQEALDGDR